MLLCVIALIEIYFTEKVFADEARDAILGVRYAVQAARLVSLLRLTHKQHSMMNARDETQIDFNVLDPEEAHGTPNADLNASSSPAALASGTPKSPSRGLDAE